MFHVVFCDWPRRFSTCGSNPVSPPPMGLRVTDFPPHHRRARPGVCGHQGRAPRGRVCGHRPHPGPGGPAACEGPAVWGVLRCGLGGSLGVSCAVHGYFLLRGEVGDVVWCGAVVTAVAVTVWWFLTRAFAYLRLHTSALTCVHLRPCLCVLCTPACLCTRRRHAPPRVPGHRHHRRPAPCVP